MEKVIGKFRWQDIVNVVLGFWIAASPWALGFSETLPLAMWSAVLVGGAIIVLAGIDLDAAARWEEWSMAVLGLWLAISPLALGFLDQRMAAGAMFASGAAVIVLAGWVLFTDGALRRQDEHAHGH